MHHYMQTLLYACMRLYVDQQSFLKGCEEVLEKLFTHSYLLISFFLKHVTWLYIYITMPQPFNLDLGTLVIFVLKTGRPPLTSVCVYLIELQSYQNLCLSTANGAQLYRVRCCRQRCHCTGAGLSANSI